MIYSNSFTTIKQLHFYFQCTCPDCRILKYNSTRQDGDSSVLEAVQVSGMDLKVGDRIHCLYQGLDEVLLYRHSTGMVLNIMLWPTLIFIVGFVGLVFACLFVQTDDCSRTCSCSLPQFITPWNNDTIV